VKRRPNVFAAVSATVIVFIALSPLLYGMLGLYVHLPSLPSWVVVFIWLGSPGLFVADAIAGSSKTAGLSIAIMATWAFYFTVFRLFAWLESLWPKETSPKSEAHTGVRK